MDSNNIYVKFYQLAQEMLSLEDTAMHQSVGDTGITVLGRGVLSKYGKNLENMVDDLLVNHSDVPSIDNTGDFWADKSNKALSDAEERLKALQKRVDSLKDDNTALKFDRDNLKAQLEDAQANNGDSDDLISENTKLKSENKALHDQVNTLTAHLADKTNGDQAAADSKIDAVDDHVESSATAPADDNPESSASAADLMSEDATNADRSIIDGAIDNTAAADNSASDGDDGESLDIKGNLASADALDNEPASSVDDGLGESPDDDDNSGVGDEIPDLSGSGDGLDAGNDDEDGTDDLPL